MESKELRSGNLFKLLTPLSKFQLFYNSEYRLNKKKLSLITLKDDCLHFDYTIFSRNAFKNYLKFSTEDRFELKSEQNNQNTITNNSTNKPPLEQIRKQEIFIKYLKGLSSKITRVLVQFSEKSLYNCEKITPIISEQTNINPQKNEKNIIKSIFLLETEETDVLFDKIDFNLMYNDDKIVEWEGFYCFSLCL